jgi:hypothetical protein
VKLGMASEGDTVSAITIDANNIEGSSIVSATDIAYKVDFTEANSIWIIAPIQ